MLSAMQVVYLAAGQKPPENENWLVVSQDAIGRHYWTAHADRDPQLVLSAGRIPEDDLERVL